LRRLNRRIIVVPDLDKSGIAIIDRAVELGFEVAIPNWAPEIKDTNDAVLKYGKVATLLSILQQATSSKIKIEMQRKKIAQRI
jgi:DNA primase